jgi:membrane protease YdiL (CAAX protease family)
MSKNLSYSNNLEKFLPKSKPIRAVLLIIGTIVLFFSAQIIGVLLIFSILSIFGYNPDEIQTMLTDNIYVQFVSILIIEIITLLLIAYVLKLKGKSLWKSVALGTRPTLSNLGYSVIAYGAYFIVFIFIAVFVSWAVPVVDIDQAQQLGFDSPEGLELIPVYLSLVILPAFVEEVLFRGFLFQRLKALINIKVAVIITSLIFSVAHLEFLSGGPLNYIAAIDTFIFSIFLIALLLKTKTLWASIFLHGIKNSIAFVVLFII